jgi:hypothetical protein
VPLLTGQLVTDQLVTDPHPVSGYEAVARALRDARFRDEALLHAVSILDSFILGSALGASAPLGMWAGSPDPGGGGGGGGRGGGR